MADGNGNGIMQDLASSVQPFELRIIYHPVTHQISCTLPVCDDIIRLGMLEFAKMILSDARAQQKPVIAAPAMFRAPRQ